MQPRVEDGYIRIKVDCLISQSAKSYYLDCEGDKVWIAKKCCKFSIDYMTVDIEEWLYNNLFGT